MPPPNIFIYKITENNTDHFQGVDAHVNLSDNAKIINHKTKRPRSSYNNSKYEEYALILLQSYKVLLRVE